MVPVYALLLFGGRLTVHHVEGLISLDNWAKFKAPAQIATLVTSLLRLITASQIRFSYQVVSSLLETRAKSSAIEIIASFTQHALTHSLALADEVPL